MTSPWVEMCYVTQRISAILPDGPDLDHVPDHVPISGTVTFTPNIRTGDAFKIFDDDGPRTTVPAPYVVDIQDGHITHNGYEGIWVFAAGDDSNPKSITYTAEYENLRAGDVEIELRKLVFEAIPGAHVDLSTAVPVAGTTGQGIVQGDPGRDGDTPYIGEGGTWWLGGVDTGVVADPSTAAAEAVSQALSVVPVTMTEAPPGSGLYELGGQNIALIESPESSGLYEIGFSA